MHRFDGETWFLLNLLLVGVQYLCRIHVYIIFKFKLKFYVLIAHSLQYNSSPRFKKHLVYLAKWSP
jgi:hypothetical protein